MTGVQTCALPISKVVLVRVQGARATTQAKKIAHAIVTSPLVKTALFGEDPNWGRVMAAIGRAGVPVNPKSIDLYFDNIQVIRISQDNSDKSKEVGELELKLKKVNKNG